MENETLENAISDCENELGILTRMNTQLQGLSMADLISGPLENASKASIKLPKTTEEFISQVQS